MLKNELLWLRYVALLDVFRLVLVFLVRALLFILWQWELWSVYKTVVCYSCFYGGWCGILLLYSALRAEGWLAFEDVEMLVGYGTNCSVWWNMYCLQMLLSFLLRTMLKVEYINRCIFNMENGLFLYFFVQEGVYFNLNELRW
jgi:hypothetical protein